MSVISIFSLDKKYDRWSFERILRHVMYWGVWLTFYCIINGSQHGNRYLEWLLLEAVVMVVKLPYAYFVAYYLMPKFIPQRKYVPFALIVIFLAFVGIAIVLMINRHFPYGLENQPVEFWTGKTFYRALDLIYVASLVLIIKLFQKYYQEIRANAQLREEKIGAELQILKNQLQPHFLFNTLNNIYSMVLSGEKKAAGALMKLSEIISYMLYECNVDMVDFDKEVQVIRNYIELEKIRYGERLDLSFEITGQTGGKRIPPLLLIPFIENAFKHGASKEINKAWIRIHIQVEREELSFMLENSIPEGEKPLTHARSGIGLENVSKRLDLLFGEDYTLRISEADTFLVNLKIPL